MKLDRRFSIFCAQKCLPLWQAPQEVVEWLEEDPNNKTANAAAAAKTAWAVANIAYRVKDATVANAAYTTYYATYTASNTADYAARALNISVDDLKQEFVSTWSEAELSITDPSWIEYATVEILNREEAV